MRALIDSLTITAMGISPLLIRKYANIWRSAYRRLSRNDGIKYTAIECNLYSEQSKANILMRRWPTTTAEA
jgi:hypothetical protein